MSLRWSRVENSKGIIVLIPGVSSSTEDYYVQDLILHSNDEVHV